MVATNETYKEIKRKNKVSEEKKSDNNFITINGS